MTIRFRQRKQRGFTARALLASFSLGALAAALVLGLVYHLLHTAEYAEYADEIARMEFDPEIVTGSRAEDPGAAPSAERKTRGRRQARVLFTKDGRSLSIQDIPLSQPLESLELAAYALERLFDGPVDPEMRPTVPEETRLRALFLDGKTAVVDLEGRFQSQPLGGPMAELLCAYAVVHTVTENVPEAKEVRLLMEGENPGVLWEELDLSSPLAPNPALIAD